MNQTQELSPYNLGQFTGTEQYFKHWTKALVYTDGVQFIGANGGYWIIDLIASHQNDVFTKKNPFQFWKIGILPDGGFVTRCEDGNGKHLVSQDGEFTDLKNDIELFLIADEQFKAVLLLTSEY